MSGRHVQSPARALSGPRRLMALLALLATAALALTLASTSATAASKTVATQLSLTGLASEDNPLGGSVIGIKPGDKVSFETASVPTKGLDKLGLGDLVGGLLNGLLGFQSSADFHNLPGGKANTTVGTSNPIVFSFPKAGTYKFTWEIQKLQLLGAPLSIDLNGNQLKDAGVKLNASNQYVGSIVVSDNPPKGGISIQLPGVSVAPSLPIVGQLPTIGVPGVQVPTLNVQVPNLLPSASKAPSGNAPGGKTSTAPDNSSYTPPGLSVPDMVVPRGAINGIYGSVGDQPLSLAQVQAASTGGDTSSSGSGSSGSTSAAGSKVAAAKAQAQKTVDLATDAGSPSSSWPMLLALLAILVLALVAGLYARLFLVRKS